MFNQMKTHKDKDQAKMRIKEKKPDVWRFITACFHFAWQFEADGEQSNASLTPGSIRKIEQEWNWNGTRTVHVSNCPDKHFVTAEMKELIENKFRHPEKNESCHTSVSMCSSKREGRNRLMYMSGPVHISIQLKRS